MKDANELQLGVLKSRTLERELQILETDRKVADERNKQMVERAQQSVTSFRNLINGSSVRNSKDRLKQAKIRFGEMLAASYPEWTEAVMDPVVFRQNIYYKNLEDLRRKQQTQEEEYHRKRISYIETARKRSEYLNELVRPRQGKDKELAAERERSLSLLKGDVDASTAGLHAPPKSLNHSQDHEVRRDNTQVINDPFNITGSQLSAIFSRPGTQEKQLDLLTDQELNVRTPPSKAMNLRSSRDLAILEETKSKDHEPLQKPKLPSLEESASRHQGAAFAALEPPVYFEELLPNKKHSEDTDIPKDSKISSSAQEGPLNVVALTSENLAQYQKVIRARVAKPQENTLSARESKPPGVFTYDAKLVEATMARSEADRETKLSVSRPTEPVKQPEFGKKPEKTKVSSGQAEQPRLEAKLEPAVVQSKLQLELKPDPKKESKSQPKPQSDISRLGSEGLSGLDSKNSSDVQLRPTPVTSSSLQASHLLKASLLNQSEPERPRTPDLNPSRQPEPKSKVTTPDPEIYKASLNSGIEVVLAKPALLPRPGSPKAKQVLEVVKEQTLVKVPTFGPKATNSLESLPGNETVRSGVSPAFVIKKVSSSEIPPKKKTATTVQVVAPNSRSQTNYPGVVIDLGNTDNFEPDAFSDELPSPPKDGFSPVTSLNSTANPTKVKPQSLSQRSEVSLSSANSSRLIDNPPLICKHAELLKLDTRDRVSVIDSCFRRIKIIAPPGQDFMRSKQLRVSEDHVAQAVATFLNDFSLEGLSPQELLTMVMYMGVAQDKYFAAPELVQKKTFTEGEMTARMDEDLHLLYQSLKSVFLQLVEAGQLSTESAPEMFTGILLNYQTSRRQFQRVQAFVTDVFQKRAASATPSRKLPVQVNDLTELGNTNEQKRTPSKVNYASLSDFEEVVDEDFI